jgi:nucleolar protein 56
LIQNAPLEKKGKIARILAAKLSLAAKIDFYSHEDRSEKMKKELNEKVKEVLSAK